MGILKYYSPYIENSIKIKIHYEKEKKLFPDDKINKIIDRFKKFTFNLDKIDGKNLENKKKFEEINMESCDNGDYYLTLFYNGLLKDMNNLFEDCTSFIEIDLSKFNIYKVKSMNKTFNNCSEVTKIIFPNSKNNNIEEMEFTFNGCRNLKEINFLGFSGVKLTRYQQMFKGTSIEEKECGVEGNRIIVYSKDKKIKRLLNKNERLDTNENLNTHRIPFQQNPN